MPWLQSTLLTRVCLHGCSVRGTSRSCMCDEGLPSPVPRLDLPHIFPAPTTRVPQSSAERGMSSDAVVPDDVSIIADDATGAVAPMPTRARRGCAGKAAVAGLLVVLGVALVVAILAGSHASSGVSLPDVRTSTRVLWIRAGRV